MLSPVFVITLKQPMMTDAPYRIIEAVAFGDFLTDAAYSSCGSRNSSDVEVGYTTDFFR